MSGRQHAVVTTPDLSHKAPTLDIPNPYVPTRIADATLTLQGGAADDLKPIPFAFGLVQTEGSIRYGFQHANDLWVVRALALGEREATIYGGEQAGECDGLVGVYDDAGPFSNFFFSYWWYSGSLTQTYNTNLAAFDSSWTESLVITDKTGKRRAICYVVERWSNVNQIWSSGIKKVRYRFRGSRVKNTTTGTVAYTTNPWWQARFWALDPSGARLKPSRINEASFQTAAANSPSGLYESNMLLSGTTRDCRKQFGLLGAGWLVYAGGNQLTAIADRQADPVVATYDDTHLSKAKPIEIGPTADPDQVVNKVSIEYTDTTDTSGVWKLVTISLPTAGLLAGTETEVPATFKFPQIQQLAVAQQMLGYILYSYQETRIKGNWLANAGGPRLVGDVVTQSIPARGISDNFRVMVRDKQDNGTFDVELALIDARKWAGATSTPAAKVSSTLQDPYSPSAPTGLTFTPVVDQPMPGIFVPRMLVGFTPAINNFYLGTKAIYSINGGPSIETAPVQTSPISIPVPDGIAVTVSVNLYTVSVSGAVSAPLPGATSTYNPNAPEMIGDVSFTADGKGFYFTNAPVRTYAVYTGWTHFSMAAFTAAKMQDGDLATTAATWGANGVYCGVVLDALVPINPHEFLIRHSTLNQADSNGIVNPTAGGVNVEFSDDNATWTADGSSNGTSDPDFKATLLTIRRTSNAAHRYWRFSKGSNVFLTGNITEIQIATWTGANFPYMAGFKLTGFTPAKKTDNGTPTPLYTNDIFTIPTAANPLLIENFKYSYSTLSALTGGGGGGSNGYVEIRTISPTGALSSARTVRLALSAFSSVGFPGPQDYQPLKRADKAGAGTWVNDAIFDNVGTIYAATGAGDYKLNSLADASGFASLYEGRVVYVVNTGAGNVQIASGGSQLAGAPAGSTVVFPSTISGVSTLTFGPGAMFALSWDSTASTWRLLLPSVAGPLFVSGVLGVDGEGHGVVVDAGGNQRYGLIKTTGAGTELRWLTVATIGWRFRRITAGTLINPITSDVPFEVDNNGHVNATNGYYEHGRSVALGDRIDVAYAGSNFTGGGGGTWTVDAGDVISLWYSLAGGTMMLGFELNNTSMAAPSFVQFVLPGGFTAARTVFQTFEWYDGISTWSDGQITVAAGATVIKLWPKQQTGTFPSGTNVIHLRGQIMIPI